MELENSAHAWVLTNRTGFALFLYDFAGCLFAYEFSHEISTTLSYTGFQYELFSNITRALSLSDGNKVKFKFKKFKQANVHT